VAYSASGLKDLLRRIGASYTVADPVLPAVQYDG
jgi:hypothetical protein